MPTGVRWLAAISIALLLAFLVLREAFVIAYAGREPGRAAALWPTHPSVELESGLAQIGNAVAVGRPVDRQLVERLLAISSRAPLAAEPFLVRGVQVRLEGNEALAGRAFEAARMRDPRLIAARYFLADHYLRTGQSENGLAEISVLARLVPQSLPQLAPHLANYARTPGMAPQVKAIVAKHPHMEYTLLNALAADARDTKLVLYLWTGRQDEAARQWQTRLLQSLVEAGRYGEARAAWGRFEGSNASGPVDPEFRPGRLAPFGWTLVADSSGIAEPQGQGRLHVIYYGRDDKTLASQLLTLRPGRHRLSMQVSGATPTVSSLAWTIHCQPSSDQVVSLPLDGKAKNGELSATFAIPAAGCGAQRLELVGTAPEFAEQAEVTIGNLRLAGEGRP